MNAIFESINDFYVADSRRLYSGEVDFGVLWRDGQMWPTYRVSWVMETGEFYAIRLSGRHDRVELLGTVEGRTAAEDALDGWANIEPMELSWVRARLAAAA
jgi:hypothetical protein